jgi:hypothetical protein
LRCLEEQRTKRLIITLLDRQDFEFVLRTRIEELRWYSNACGLGPEKDAIYAQRILSCDGDLIASDCDRYLRRLRAFEEKLGQALHPQTALRPDVKDLALVRVKGFEPFVRFSINKDLYTYIFISFVELDKKFECGKRKFVLVIVGPCLRGSDA